MQIIVYASPFAKVSRHLIEIVQKVGKPKALECLHTLESLTTRLRQPLTCFDALLIVCPANGYELAQMTAISHLLRDLRVIVLLPDREAGTISDGHMLRPRFLSYSDSDLNDVVAVVEKMAASNPMIGSRPGNA